MTSRTRLRPRILLAALLATSHGSAAWAADPASPAPVAAPVPPAAPTGPPIGLREALTRAVRANPSLASEAIDVDIADAEIRETYGLDDWLIDAGVSYDALRITPIADEAYQRTGSDRIDVSASLTRPLSTGGRLGLRFDTGWSRGTSLVTFGDPAVAQSSTATTWGPGLQVVFFQPLLRGFGERNRNADRTRARAGRDVQELERAGAAGTVVRDVVQAYWELAYATADLAIRRQALALAREQLRVTQAGIDVGKLPRSEALAVEQTIATREEEVFLAEQNVAERSIELRRLVGLEIGPGHIELTAADELGSVARDPDLDAALARAMEANPQLGTIRASGRSARIEVELTENGLLPQLDFSAAAGPSGRATAVGEAFTGLGSFDTYAVSAGVVFSMRLGETAAHARRDAARLRVRKASLSEADVRAQIAAQTVRAVNLVRSARKRMEVAARATTLAGQNVELETARWQVGKSTNFDVLMRQEELEESQLRQARARADYLAAVATLEALTGEILPRYGIGLARR